jgi:periplasmic divalent cation tolerance protein
MKTKVMIVFSSAGSRDEAERIAKLLIEERLAGCVQYMPVSSIYKWKGKIESASEWLMIIKTRARLIKEVISRIKQLHSYELPEIVAVDVSNGLPEYLAWVISETEQKV